MIARLNWAAKAVIAFAVPVAALLVDVAGSWAGISEDGIVGLSEWQAFGLAVISAVLVFFKSNGPAPDA